MEVIVIQNSHIIAFGIGAVVGTVLTGVTIGLLIPSMVKGAFNKIKRI